MDEFRRGRGDWRQSGKVITRWCKADARRGFTSGWEGNEILIWIFSFTFAVAMQPQPRQPPTSKSCLLPDLLMLFFELVCIMYGRFWSGVKAWHGRPDSKSRWVPGLTRRIKRDPWTCPNVLKMTNCTSPPCGILNSCLETMSADILQTHKLIFHLMVTTSNINRFWGIIRVGFPSTCHIYWIWHNVWPQYFSATQN